MTDDSQAFVREVAVVQFDGRAVEVRPLTVHQIISISKPLQQLLPAVEQIQQAIDGDVTVLLALLASHGEPLLDALSEATGIERSALQQTRDLAGLIRLIAEVVKLNLDFFGQQVGQIKAGLQGAPAASDGDGQTPSTALSAQDIH